MLNKELVVGNLEILTTDSDDVFIRICENGPMIRVSSLNKDTLYVTALGYRISLTYVNGLDAIRVTR